MYETKFYTSPPVFTQNPGNPASLAAQVTKEALHSYRAALLRGSLGRLLAKLTGGQGSLLDLNEVVKQVRVGSRYYARLQAVPIQKIIGSQGRCGDFDTSFNPLNEETRDRWLNIARARRLGTALPPVELIQMGDCYFVRDGHHRISVARSLGEQAVDAEVTVWEAAGHLPWEPAPEGSWELQTA